LSLETLEQNAMLSPNDDSMESSKDKHDAGVFEKTAWIEQSDQ
jgi:hypothetical protein